MSWAAGAPQLGFSTARPWLPAGPDHAALSVDRQESDAASLLHLTRRLLALRNGEPALRFGAMEIVEASDTLLMFARIHGNQRLLCAFNFGDAPVAWDAPGSAIGAVNGAEPGAVPPKGGLIVRAA